MWLLWLGLVSLPASGSTWYVRPDGGTRHSSRVRSGQCDGLADAPYAGSGSNRHCAFKDARYLWQDGSSATAGEQASFPAYGWVGAGGDTYIIRGSIQSGVSYRVGWGNKNGALDEKTKQFWGVAGDPYGSGVPPPLSGTAMQHTRILGENYASCKDPKARTQLHGGFGVLNVLDMEGSSYVDVACLDITDFSSCGRSAQANGCNTNVGSLSDFATNGIRWSNTSTHDTLTDVKIHGMGSAGMLGPVGDGTVFTDWEVSGNATSGWNADAGDGTTGTGSLLVQQYVIAWNGCAEEYPLMHAVPYGDCTDDNSGGYGDGFGTTTAPSHPGWKVHFDQGEVYYNTQDGLDALHLTGAGSSMTVTHTLAYGNMGQQFKVGGAAGTMEDNVVFTNCNALRQAIPGTPPGFNSKLSDFCRAADAGIVMTVGDGTTTVFRGNVIYSAARIAVEVDTEKSCSTPTCLVHHDNNVFIGYRNSPENGYPPNMASGDYPSPWYMDDAARAYLNPGSTFSGNTVFRAKGNWSCPAVRMHETHAKCGDPKLKDEKWPLYGHADVSSLAAGKH